MSETLPAPRVLLAFDGSDHARTAAALVAGAAWPAGTLVRVVTAVRDPAGLRKRWVTDADEVAAIVAGDRWATAAEAMDEVARLLEGRTFGAEFALLPGVPATTIVDEVRAFEASLVVIGSRGRGPVASALLGSVAREVIDTSPVPVLVARSSSLSRVLLAADGSAGAPAAERGLGALPLAPDARVRVLSVAEVEPTWGIPFAPTGQGQLIEWRAAYEAEARRRHTALAADAARRLRAGGRRVEHVTRVGSADVEILAEADEWGADLIVMGSRGHVGVKRLVLGSVGGSVLTRTATSVLTVPPDEPRVEARDNVDVAAGGGPTAGKALQADSA